MLVSLCGRHLCRERRCRSLRGSVAQHRRSSKQHARCEAHDRRWQKIRRDEDGCVTCEYHEAHREVLARCGKEYCTDVHMSLGSTPSIFPTSPVEPPGRRGLKGAGFFGSQLPSGQTQGWCNWRSVVCLYSTDPTTHATHNATMERMSDRSRFM